MSAVAQIPASVPTPPAERAATGPARRRITPYLLLLPGVLWLVGFFLVPMITLASTSLQTGSLEQGYQLTWRWANYTDALATYKAQFGRAFLYAALATVFALIISYPLAYTIAFKAGRWRNVMLVLVIAPFFTSFLIRTIAWKTILSDTGLVADVMRSLGLLGLSDGRLLGTTFAVVAGLTYNFLPFMTLPLYAALERMDPQLIEAAEDLYSSPVTAFRKVTFPLSMPGVVAGTLLTFIPAAGDFINRRLLGNPKNTVVGDVIDSRFHVIVDYPTAAALSFSLMIAIVVLVMAYIRRAGTEELV